MKTKKYLKLLNAVASFLFLCNISFAQESNPQDTLTDHVKKLNDDVTVLKKVKISGYIQGQFQYADSNGVKSYEGGDFAANVDKRFMLRRARVKVTYNGNFSQYVFQIDATEKGVLIKDMYAKFTEPWLKTVSVTLGQQNRPFGYEIGYSSSDRESPERGRMSQIIFPGERDLGAMLTIQAPKTSKLNAFKIEAGLFNGTGAANVAGTNLEFDKKKDFIGHLTYTKSLKNEKINFGIGLSYYNGGWRTASPNKYDMGDVVGVKQFIKTTDVANVGTITKRNYIGADAQVNMDLPWGLATLRGEYIAGTQPGVKGSTVSPQVAPTDAVAATSKITVKASGKDTTITLTPAGTTPADVYNRNFNGAYIYFIQNIARTKLQLIAKYDWYDPNIKVKGKDIGAKGSNLTSADVKFSTLAFGLAYKWDNNIKITAYYAMVKNEVTLLKGFEHEIPDNIFTLRVQYKF